MEHTLVTESAPWQPLGYECWNRGVTRRGLTGRLAGRLAGRVQATSVPWAAQVVSWIDLVDLCRELDDGLIAAETQSAELLALHEAVVNLAIGCGGWLIHQIRTNRADISASGHTVETLQASLELLRILHRGRHSNFSYEEIESTRRRIFNAAAWPALTPTARAEPYRGARLRG